MTYEILVGGLGLFAMIAGVVSPILKLNNNITELKMSVDSLKDTIAELKDKMSTQSKEIDAIKLNIANHEMRLHTLEKEEEK